MSKKGQIALICLVALLAGVVLMGPVASQTPTPTPTGSASGSASPTPTQSASPSPSDPNHITFTRDDRGNDDQELPIVHAGKKRRGFSRGDITTFRTPLLLPGTRDQDGRLTAQCQVLVITRPRIEFLCTAEAIFDEGRITATGTLSFFENAPGSTIAITGGTGDYEHARGTVTVDEADTGPSFIVFDIHLE